MGDRRGESGSIEEVRGNGWGGGVKFKALRFGSKGNLRGTRRNRWY